MFNGGERGQRANFYAIARNIANSAQLAYAAQVQHVRRREQLLLHRRQQVGPAGNNLYLAVMLCHEADGFLECLRA